MWGKLENGRLKDVKFLKLRNYLCHVCWENEVLYKIACWQLTKAVILFVHVLILSTVLVKQYQAQAARAIINYIVMYF